MDSAAELIRITRKELGLTQAELAGLAHTTQSAIARLESGKTQPNLGKVDWLLAIMGKKLTFDARSLEALDSGVDNTLIYTSLRKSPGERLRYAEGATKSIDTLRRTARRVT